MATTVVNCDTTPFDVYIGRKCTKYPHGSPWTNPFWVAREADRTKMNDRYRAWALGQPALVAQIKAQLKDKVLGCHCPPMACHGQVLAEIADS